MYKTIKKVYPVNRFKMAVIINNSRCYSIVASLSKSINLKSSNSNTKLVNKLNLTGKH